MTTDTPTPTSNVPEPTITHVGRVDYAEFFTKVEQHRYDDTLQLYHIELHYDSLEDEETLVAVFGLPDLRWAARLFEQTLEFIQDHRDSQPETEAAKVLRAHLESASTSNT